MTTMILERKGTPAPTSKEFPGIIIRDWTPESAEGRLGPRVRAFIYGEALPSLPTLPFGRWKTGG